MVDVARESAPLLGVAGVCKTLIPGSNPGAASNLRRKDLQQFLRPPKIPGVPTMCPNLRFWGRGSVYPRGARWWAKYRDPATGEVVRQPLGPTVRTRDQAERVLRRTIDRLRADLERPETVTLGQALEGFLADKAPPNRERWTWLTYTKHAAHFRRLLPCQTPMGLVSSEHIRAYRDARTKQGAKPQTVNKERVTLSTLFKWAMRQVPPLVDRNPVLAIPPLTHRRVEQVPCPPKLFAEVVAAVRADAASRPSDQAWRRTLWADVAELGPWTGWRAGEVCAIRVRDLDMKARTCELRSAWNKGGTVTAPFAAEAAPIIARRLAAVKDLGPDAHVFGDPEGGHAYDAMYRWWTKWVAKHADHRPAHLHSTRHAFTTDLDRLSESDALVQKLTRHRTARMRLHYTHRDLAEMRDALSALGRLRKRSRPPRKRE